MEHTKTLDIGSDDVFDLIRDYEALRTWELVRAIGAPATVAELSQARKLPVQVLYRHLTC